MEMLYQQKLNQPQLDGVWQLLLRYGDTFVVPDPSLHLRLRLW